jgi:cytochrome b subunit of formate dehydrogenase
MQSFENRFYYGIPVGICSFSADLFSRIQKYVDRMLNFRLIVVEFISVKNMHKYCLFAFLSVFVSGSAFGQSSEICLACHGNRALTVQRQGRSISLYVDSESMKGSVHAPLPCTICHRGLNPASLPHAKVMQPLQCQSCHQETGFEKSIHGPIAQCKICHGTHQILSAKDPKSLTNRLSVSGVCAQCHPAEGQQFVESSHGVALKQGDKKSASCVDCHGSHKMVHIASQESPLFKTKEAKVCLKCHLEDPAVRKQIGTSPGFMESYEASIHAVALASGNGKSATCSDCHGAHDSMKAKSPSSRLNKWNIAGTCSRCHANIAKIYSESIHGKSLQQGKAESPTCTDCHGEHQILAPKDPRSPVSPRNVSVQVCAGCHNSVQLNQKYGMPSERFNSFMDSYHGLALRAGSVEVANCASCHGIHNIKPSSDPSSTVNPANLAVTCGRCHPGANKNFARGAVHVVNTRAAGGGVLYWIRAIYIVLIIVVVGGMLVHNLLDFVQKTRVRFAMRQGKLEHEQHRTAQYIRMTLNERIQHAVMLTTFILLVITGFILKFPDAWWVVSIRRMSEKFFEVRSLVHRVAGSLMIAISIYHLYYISFTRLGRGFLKDIFPKWKDVMDALANLLYISGLSKKKPLFDRFCYIEKAEYWALVWGVVLMGATGIVMWFENYFIGLFTKLGWDIARTIHFYEACLATLAIVVWHFYFVMFNPNIYPMNTAWLTGKISEEEMAEEHPLQLSRLQSESEGKPGEPA